MPPARSIYRQVRLTVSEQPGGLCTVRVLAKPLHEDWKTLHSVWHGQFRPTTSTTHWSELLLATAEEVLSQRLFPE